MLNSNNFAMQHIWIFAIIFYILWDEQLFYKFK